MELRDDATAIFQAALHRADPAAMIRRCCNIEKSSFTTETEEARVSIDLSSFDRILVCGAGKASARMAVELVSLLGDRVTGGLVVTKEGEAHDIGPVSVVTAGHPVPDARSEEAAKRLLALAAEADARTLVVNLISGGGSALLCAPWSGDYAITLDDKRGVTDALLRCGAEIKEINTVRKHLSAIKGGRLAAALAPATSVNLILSDIVGDPLDGIASGLTVADPTTFADAVSVIRRYNIGGVIPEAAKALLEAGARGGVPETPKPGSAELANVRNLLLGTNFHGLKAAVSEAGRLGYTVLPLTSQITGEAREVAKVFSGIVREIRARSFPLAPPACVIAGGETTVTVRGTGKGGRNQELALAFLAELAQAPERYAESCFLSASTDGNDGPTDAAGAFADAHVLAADAGAAGGATGRDPARAIADALAENDAYSYFDARGGLLKTGITGTNVCDYQIALVGRA